MDLHVFTIPIPPSRLPPRPIPLGPPGAPAPSTRLMPPAWAGGLFHERKVLRVGFPLGASRLKFCLFIFNMHFSLRAYFITLR